MSLKEESPMALDGDAHLMFTNKVEPLPDHPISLLKQEEMSASPGSLSKSATPPPNSRKQTTFTPQLIGHLPVSTDEALATFEQIQENWYMYKSLGRSRELGESMSCDCQFVPGVDSPETACGHGSDCINRLTQVECLPDDCRCKSYCQNQRFQRREYAPIVIVKTEMKGYGLRAEEDIRKDTFIYEYVGDVVGDASFKKRMREYAEEGIQHFYFMMLQKDEFIDATKHGGIARFANHSCSPNCYVAKWTIGNHVRMGIFAKRNILKHEELTFNYNVDRYGHQAQTCYCGEPNCVGFIGGKTQTDISTIDDLYLDALGITDENDLRELKGTKKKKGKKIDDPDFMPTLRALQLKDVPKVIQAIRQTQSKKVLAKLLTRIKLTTDDTALRQVMRLRGYSLMKNILEDYKNDVEMLILALETMWSWPLIHLNKVEDSEVHKPVKVCAEHEHESIKVPAQKLLDHWSTLETNYRIPKRLKTEDDEPFIPSDSTTQRVYCEPDEVARETKRTKVMEGQFQKPFFHRPTGFRHEDQRLADEDHQAKEKQEKQLIDHFHKQKKEELNNIIAAAKKRREEEEAAAEAEKAAAAKQAEEEAAAKAEAKRKRQERKKKKRAPETEEQKAANKEKRLLKLVAAVVVKCMSKYGKGLDRERMKRHAKELTQVIADKEKKSASYKEGRLEAFSDEKVAKIKKFSKEYIEKIVYKMKKEKRSTTSAVENTPASTLMDTPQDESSESRPPEMTVEEAMEMDSDSESDDDGDEDRIHSSPTKELLAANGTPPEDDEAMDIDISPMTLQASDPRRRPPNVNPV